MRASKWQLVGAIALPLMFACQGLKGEKGDQGDIGPQGPQGPVGTFSGTFNGAATFSGPTDLNGTTRFNGDDLFTASVKGTYPAVVSQILSGGSYQCGVAPTDFEVTTIAGISAAYGSLMYTNQGQTGQNYSLVSNPCPSANICYGTLTFFLKNPVAAKTITLPVFIDNGPSYVYVDGNRGPNAFRTPALTNLSVNANVTVPSGSFALSFIVCSNDGASITFSINNTFITSNNLTVDYDRTFHRNGM